MRRPWQLRWILLVKTAIARILEMVVFSSCRRLDWKDERPMPLSSDLVLMIVRYLSTSTPKS